MTRIAIIGAGISGLVVARALAARADVVVFEKSRGVGGRMATRRSPPWQFDHGAQFFTARTDAFRDFLSPLIDSGVVRSWNAHFAELRRDRISATRAWQDDYPHFVATPGMNALGKHLASGLDIRLETRVERLGRDAAGWRLYTGDGGEAGRFDWTVVTAPAPQTLELLPADSVLGGHAATVRMKACFALMLGFREPLDLPWQAALVRDADLSWISVDSSKPGRGGPYSLVAHATNAWADEHIDDSIDDVRRHLLAEARAVTGQPVESAEHVAVHRWRYANLDRVDPAPPQVDAGNRIAACGDWFIRGRVEAAYTSAVTLIDALDQAI